MSTFTVYPKKGDPFILHCERFQFTGQGFVLHGSEGEAETNQAFLSVKNVAAIIPEQQHRAPESVSLKNFRIYLRNRKADDEPILISASAFDAENEPNVIFYCHRYGPVGQTEPQVVGDIYIAASEIVAIIPPKL